MPSLRPTWLVVDSNDLRQGRPPWARAVSFAEALDAAAHAVRQGELVVFPTETFYGLAVLARDAAAVARLAVSKGREAAKAVPLIAGSREQVETWASLPKALARLADRYWPGPLTVAVPPAMTLPAPLYSPLGTIGIRVSSHPLAAALATQVDVLTATSANLSGGAAVRDVRDLAPGLARAVDLVIDVGACPGGAPSTVVKVDDEGQAVVFREGAISLASLATVLGYHPRAAQHRGP